MYSSAVLLHGIPDGEIFRGFMVQARLTTDVFDPNAPLVGEFIESVSPDVQFLQCGIDSLVGELGMHIQLDSEPDTVYH